MRAKDTGDAVIVTVSGREVAEFAACWPCSGLTGSYRFEFDLNGDLVSLRGKERAVDAYALEALISDAKRCGGLPS